MWQCLVMTNCNAYGETPSPSNSAYFRKVVVCASVRSRHFSEKAKCRTGTCPCAVAPTSCPPQEVEQQRVESAQLQKDADAASTAATDREREAKEAESAVSAADVALAALMKPPETPVASASSSESLSLKAQVCKSMQDLRPLHILRNMDAEYDSVLTADDVKTIGLRLATFKTAVKGLGTSLKLAIKDQNITRGELLASVGTNRN